MPNRQHTDYHRPSGHPLVMGIVNVTPDSFSDGGEFLHDDAAIAHALQLLDEGADIVDVGGESTRPPGADYGEGSDAITSEEELRRVLPVVQGIIAARPQAIISIDTMKPEVAESAIRAGASIINDVSAGSYDAGILTVAARHDVPYIAMHGHDPHDRRPVHTIDYSDVVEDVAAFLEERITRAREAGVRQVIADPGIGFAKGAEDSMRLIRELSRLRTLDVPILVGASRKSFIGRALGGLEAQERLFGTLGAHAAAALNGADIVRVHDVRPAVEFFRLFGNLLTVA